MRGHAAVVERPSLVLGHLPAPSQLVQGTRDVATRAAGRAADLAAPLQHVATPAARRRRAGRAYGDRLRPPSTH